MAAISTETRLQNLRHAIRAGALAVTVLALARGAFAADAADARVKVTSSKSFEQVSGALQSLVAKNGMMVMAQVDQGKMLSMTGLQLKATLFLVGNPTVGKQLFEQDHAVGLYVPLRISVYSDGDGKTYVEYDKPSVLLGQFKNEKIAMIAQMLDEKVSGLATMAAQ
ncbi:MAG TPA: DUF302 domain-containing protein [Vicinamibacterales bacterium]|nr:DUF302 domain-containing protein [Vicinamibacterales bacterium]